MEHYTNQTAFNKVYNHLLTQNKKSVCTIPDSFNPGHFVTGCAYRTPDGLKCAVGCLISDELYIPEFENKCVGVLPLKDLGLDEVSLDLLEKLQSIHDDMPAKRWRETLRRTAERFELSVPK